MNILNDEQTNQYADEIVREALQKEIKDCNGYRFLFDYISQYLDDFVLLGHDKLNKRVSLCRPSDGVNSES